MQSEIILALIGLVSSAISGVFGWILGNRKRNAEASLLETAGIKAIRELYEQVINDTRAKLAYYIDLSESNRQEIHSLRRIVDSLIDDACLKKGCNMREYYNPDVVGQIISKVENSREGIKNHGTFVKKNKSP